MRKASQRGRPWWLGVALVSCLLAVVGAGSAGAQSPEFRAYWVDAWHDGYKTAAQCEQLIADVKASNCNVIIPQVRRRGDTYFPSDIEPWATDADPNFDALRYLLDRCHAETPRIQVHAWIVLLPIWNSDTPPADPNHPYLKYPQYLTKTASGGTVRTFDPGHPDCEEYLNSVVMELVTKYPDLDGINYDYSRFGAATEGYNARSVERFNARYQRTGSPASDDALWCQWRRDQITNLIRKAYVNAIAVNPNICMSSAVVTWDPQPYDRGGDFTRTRPYYDVFQDWQSWMSEGILDLSMPMCYFDLRNAYAADYVGWANFAKANQFNRATVIGPGIYMNSVANSIIQLRQARDPFEGKTAAGVVMYSYATTNDENESDEYGGPLDLPDSVFYNALSHPSQYDPNPTPIYSTPVSVPAFSWKTAPTKGHIRGTIYDCDGTSWLDCATVSVAGPENRSKEFNDGTGFYAFIDLTPGVYTVTASYPNRPSEHAQVTVTAGQVSTANFVLCADPTPPVISNVRAESIGFYSVDIKWTTDDPSTSQVDYGLTSSYGSSSPLDSSRVENHTVHLGGLVSGQTYYFRVRSRNASGFESTSGPHTFTTVLDTTPPVISNVRVASVYYDEAMITWETDEPSTSQVRYGGTSAYGSATTEDTTPVTMHAVLVTGLTPGNTYHYSAKSTNAAGLSTESADGVFTTPPFAGAEVIVDDTQASFTETSPGYVWQIGTAAGGWPTTDSSYRYVWNYRSGSRATCRWTPDLPVAGPYDVYVWYRAATENTTGARYTITHAGGTTATIYVDQQTNGSQWYKIGSALQFNAGTSGYVTLNNRTTDNSQTKYVIADAVRFVYVGGIPGDTTAPTVPQGVTATATSATSMSVSWTPSTDNIGVVGYRVFRDGQLVATTFGTVFSDSGLVANTQYGYRVSAYDARQNESGQSDETRRFTLPLAPTEASISCDRASGTWYNTARFTFGNGGFGPGGVSHYRYVWDTSPTHSWDGIEWVWAASTVGVDAVSGADGWYFHVQSYNGDDVAGGSLDKGPYYFDSDPPVISSVTVPRYLGIRGGSYDDLWASWAASDAASGIVEYFYCISNQAAINEAILPWTSSGGNMSASYHYPGVSQNSYSYYWSVKARDRAGNWASPVTSGPSVYVNAYDTLAEAMANPDSTLVMIDQPKVLSAGLDGFCYVQEPDRSRGLRVLAAPIGPEGSRVRVAGRLMTVDGERRLDTVEASLDGSGSAPAPVAVRISAIGGCAPDAYTPGLAGTSGCYNLGLLVRVSGRVSQKGPGWFVLDDGSGASARVYSSVTPADNAFVGVTGVAGVESGVRVIRTRGSGDVVAY